MSCIWGFLINEFNAVHVFLLLKITLCFSKVWGNAMIVYVERGRGRIHGWIIVSNQVDILIKVDGIFSCYLPLCMCVCVYIYIYIYIYIYNFFSDILIKLLNIEKIGFEINLPCVENTHRDCIYNKENMD